MLRQPKLRTRPTGPQINDEEKALLKAIKETDTAENTVRLVYADYVEENGRPEMAETIRPHAQPYDRDDPDDSYFEGMERGYSLFRKHMVNWYGADPFAWLGSVTRRRVEFDRGMLLVYGEPADVCNFPSSAAPWVHTIELGDTRGGVSGIFGAINRTQPRKVAFTTHWRGNRRIVNAFASQVTTRCIKTDEIPLGTVRELDLGDHPNLATLAAMMFWNPPTIKQIESVVITAMGRRMMGRNWMDCLAELRLRWLGIKGEDVFSLPRINEQSEEY
jgi:uncharacterized protein (TIGR02996 family)